MAVTRELDAQQRLRDSPVAGVSFKLPVMISERLDKLVDLAHIAGERTDRRELLAALILSVDPSVSGMTELLHQYRAATNRDAAVPGLGLEEEPLVVHSRPPGPRRRSA